MRSGDVGWCGCGPRLAAGQSGSSLTPSPNFTQGFDRAFGDGSDSGEASVRGSFGRRVLLPRRREGLRCSKAIPSASGVKKRARLSFAGCQARRKSLAAAPSSARALGASNVGKKFHDCRFRVLPFWTAAGDAAPHATATGRLQARCKTVPLAAAQALLRRRRGSRGSTTESTPARARPTVKQGGPCTGAARGGSWFPAFSSSLGAT